MNASRLNTVLHLLLNIVSTLVIASSNFFMQVLNSPNRAEIDRAHGRSRWLDIGIPSFRNARQLSRSKLVTSALFIISSIPIHLLFNSAIFWVDYSGAEWSTTLATEAFTRGSQYFAPGASLTLPGTVLSTHRSNYEFWSYGDGPVHPVDNITDYLDPQSNVSRDISAVAAEASSWALLSAEACRQEYQACQGLQFHRDIVLVIDAWGQPNETDAWVLDDIYNMSALPDSSLAGNKNYSAIWEPYVPASSPNSLWFSSPCSKRALTGGGCLGCGPHATGI